MSPVYIIDDVTLDTFMCSMLTWAAVSITTFCVIVLVANRSHITEWFTDQNNPSRGHLQKQFQNAPSGEKEEMLDDMIEGFVQGERVLKHFTNIVNTGGVLTKEQQDKVYTLTEKKVIVESQQMKGMLLTRMPEWLKDVEECESRFREVIDAMKTKKMDANTKLDYANALNQLRLKHAALMNDADFKKTVQESKMPC
ncbi:hypothetical protein T484DRAFT_1861580 [Baffinella frigidus]|nr:hypothetical protein T484DRAFT_1861580 [Cryptophyta sp. CCMP2293]